MEQTIGGRGSGIGAQAGGRHLMCWRRLRRAATVDGKEEDTAARASWWCRGDGGEDGGGFSSLAAHPL
jgi:hypothetical protein